MKKIAFFVEGQTEQIFVNRLIKEILGRGNTTVILKKISGGINAPKYELLRSYNISRKPKYTVLIYDCGADNRVKSEILENIKNLRDNGYDSIVGLRDLYPLDIDEYSRLEKGLNFLPNDMKTYKHLFDIIVAVHEVETWFLAETSHLLKVDNRLTGGFIEKHLGFDPTSINPLSRQHPSEDLKQIYKLVGKSYNKKYWQVNKLVNRLDINKIRNKIRYNIPSLDELIIHIENLKKNKIN